jgi:predicted amidohydrolase YtcJ
MASMERIALMPQSTQPPDIVITNAKVATLDRDHRIVEAVAITGEHFTAVGRSSDIAALAGPATRRIDAKGHLLVPGLIDGHAHMDREGLKDRLPSLTGCRSIADIQDRIRDLARRTPPGQWIVTMPIGEPPFYENVPGCLREGRVPNRHELDAAAPDHPVYIRAIWGHWRNTLPLVSIANSRALTLAGIGRDTLPPAPSIQIDKDHATGEPNGILYEFTYKPLVEKTLMACIPRFSLDDRIQGLARSMQVYNSFGTTSVFEGHGIAGEVLAAYQDLAERGPLSVRSVLMFSPAWPSTDITIIRDMLADWGRWLARRGMGDAYLRMCGLYTESEYSEENRLRALCGPYTGWAGFNFDACLPEDVMVEMMVEAARLGIRVGSFSPRILDLYAQVDRRASIAGQRWILEHVGIFSEDEVRKVRDLGLVVQAYSSKWIEQDGEDLRARLGEAGAERVLPMRDLIDAGVHTSLATDNVPPTLLLPIYHVVSRMTDKGRRLGPGQAIGRMEALAAASREGAYLSFEEDVKGTIEPGKYADCALLSEDLLTCEESRIAGITSTLTMTGGRIVHQATT